MKLKYERQWETVEKMFQKEIDEGNKYKFDFVLHWGMKKSIIMFVFNIYQYVDWTKLWAIFENDIDVLSLYDWEHQQKPLLDKMIELILWNKE